MATNLADMKKTQGNAGALTIGQQVQQKVAYLDKRKDLLGAGIPGHMTVEREIRTATVMLMNSKDLQAASPTSFYTAVSIAVNSGIGLGNGKGYLVAYKGNCSYVPGWKGLVDLVSRTGRGTVWTGVIHRGDHFDYALGDSQFLTHRPGDNEDHKDVTHYYAIGRVKGSEWPIIEVWSASKVTKHLNKYNKVGSGHYALKDDNNMEMYARKVVLLQVLKYMPQSQDLENAIAADTAAETNRSVTIEGGCVFINEDDNGPDTAAQQQPSQSTQARPAAAIAPRPVSNDIDASAPIDLPGDDEGDVTQSAEAAAAYDKFAARLAGATDLDNLSADADLIRDFPEADQVDLRNIYRQRKDALENPPRLAAQQRPATRAARPAMNLE